MASVEGVLSASISYRTQFIHTSRRLFPFSFTVYLLTQIDYNDPTAEEAAKEDPDIDYTDLEAGCGSSGFPWSVMRRTSEDACEGLIADDAEDDHDEDEDHDVDEDDHDGHDHGEDDHDHDDEGEHSEDGADDAEEGGEDPSGSATTYVGSKSIVFAAIALVGMIAV